MFLVFYILDAYLFNLLIKMYSRNINSKEDKKSASINCFIKFYFMQI